MVWYGMVWYGMAWYGMVWCGMVWYGMVWYGMVWYGMMGKPMLKVSLLAWATSCGGLGCAVAADKRDVPDVDQYVEKSVILLSRIRV